MKLNRRAVRILFHIPTLIEGGGAEYLLFHLATSLTKMGFIIHLLTLKPGGKIWDELQKLDGCFVSSVCKLHKWDVGFLGRIISYARQHKIDLFVGWMPPCNTYTALAAKWLGKPMLMTQFASDAVYSRGGRVYLLTDRWLAAWMALPVVYNSFRGLAFHRSLGFPEKHAVVIPNGIVGPGSLKLPRPFEHAPPWRIGMIARLLPIKNHKMMFDALDLLAARSLPVELHLYFADGDDVYEHELREYADRLTCAGKVHWQGRFVDVWETLGDMDVFCLCSDSEGMSVALTEAMMAGRVCVATDVGDAKRMLESGDSLSCGWTVPKQDAEMLADAIEAIILEPDHAIAVAERAKKKANQIYSLGGMVRKYKKKFFELVINHETGTY